LNRMSWRTPDTYQQAGIRRGTATSLQQDRGQPLSARSCGPVETFPSRVEHRAMLVAGAGFVVVVAVALVLSTGPRSAERRATPPEPIVVRGSLREIGGPWPG